MILGCFYSVFPFPVTMAFCYSFCLFNVYILLCYKVKYLYFLLYYYLYFTAYITVELFRVFFEIQYTYVVYILAQLQIIVFGKFRLAQAQVRLDKKHVFNYTSVKCASFCWSMLGSLTKIHWYLWMRSGRMWKFLRRYILLPYLGKMKKANRLSNHIFIYFLFW